jgi:hypothetical protein
MGTRSLVPTTLTRLERQLAVGALFGLPMERFKPPTNAPKLKLLTRTLALSLLSRFALSPIGGSRAASVRLVSVMKMVRPSTNQFLANGPIMDLLLKK